ncbi:MAG: polysaccharide lyase family 8 super-sandwich domain-containing protein, partial [Ginsengibacter sp.]
DVQAKKAWFFFDDEVVCLGTGINSNSAENITTTLNQSWLMSGARISLNGKIENVGKEQNVDNPDWVWQENTGYFFLQPSNVNVSAGTQSGNWALINASRSKQQTTSYVFKLWVNHGVKPTDGSYAYMVVPGINEEGMNLYNKQNIKVLENSNSIQAVKNEKLQMMQIVFHKAGTISDNGVSISAEKPCVLLLKNIDSKNVSMYVADPSQILKEVTITVKTKLMNGEKKVNCNLPTGNFAGSSATFPLN